MVGKANCEKIRERMPDAVVDALSGRIHAAFDAHVADCAACAKEFQRVRTLSQAIDRGLSAGLSVEPSPQLISNVRRQIAAQPHRAMSWWQRRAWLTAAGVCATLAILVLTVRSRREFNRTANDHATSSINVPSTPKPTVYPRVDPVVQAAAAARPRARAVPVVSHALHQAHEKSAGPAIIVQPGQMRAVLRLAKATQNGQIDGAKLLADQKNAAEPIDIKPLVIAPLKIAALDDETMPDTGGEKGDKDSVAGHLR